MKKDIAMKWIKALRSGDYIQGQAELRNLNNKYCCLGVLCEITKLDHGYNDYTELPDEKGRMNHFLSKELLEFTGIKTKCGDYINGNLVNDNDTREHSFEEIANTIEKHWKEL